MKVCIHCARMQHVRETFMKGLLHQIIKVSYNAYITELTWTRTKHEKLFRIMTKYMQIFDMKRYIDSATSNMSRSENRFCVSDGTYSAFVMKEVYIRPILHDTTFLRVDGKLERLAIKFAKAQTLTCQKRRHVRSIRCSFISHNVWNRLLFSSDIWFNL